MTWRIDQQRQAQQWQIGMAPHSTQGPDSASGWSDGKPSGTQLVPEPLKHL